MASAGRLARMMAKRKIINICNRLLKEKKNWDMLTKLHVAALVVYY